MKSSLALALSGTLLLNLARAVEKSTLQCLKIIDEWKGTCVMSKCDPSWGPTECNFGVCFCAEGHCAGIDRVCRPQPYKQLPGSYKIESALHKAHYMSAYYGKESSSIHLHEYSSGMANTFSIFLLPAQEGDGAMVLGEISGWLFKSYSAIKWSSGTLNELQSNKPSVNVVSPQSAGLRLYRMESDRSDASLVMLITASSKSLCAATTGSRHLKDGGKEYYTYKVKKCSTKKKDQASYWYITPKLPDDVWKLASKTDL